MNCLLDSKNARLHKDGEDCLFKFVDVVLATKFLLCSLVGVVARSASRTGKQVA